MQEMLSKEKLRDEKPSNLLRCMMKRLDDKYSTYNKDFFLHLFLSAPANRLSMKFSFSVKDKLLVEEVAQLAEDFMVTLPPDFSVACYYKSRDRLSSRS